MSKTLSSSVCRQQLAILTRCALTGDISNLDEPTERDAAWHFCEKVEELIEAVWMIESIKNV